MNEQIKNQIKQIVSMPAWKYIEDIFKDEVLEGKKPVNFKTEGKTAEMIALEAMAREKAAKIVTKTLNKLNRIKNDKEYEKQSYK